MANIYRVIYDCVNAPVSQKAVNVSATTLQNAHDAAKAADPLWTKVITITQVRTVDVTGS